jgi:hypothetical protein
VARPTGSVGARARSSPLAHAAAGQPHLGPGGYPADNDPFELLRARHVDGTGPQTPSAPVPPTPASSSTSTGTPPPPQAQYDVSVDPVLQQVKAAAAAGDAAAQARATAAQQQALLGYGDPALAGSILGASDPFVEAARQNQESTLARLKRGYDQGLWNFDNTLDPSLAFSGARIRGEGQLGQTYQDDLASAAANIQSQLGGIQDTYDAARAADADKISQALADAYDRMIQAALTNPPATLAGAAAGG